MKASNYRIQQVMSEPSKVLVGEYKTKSGQIKNKYTKNPFAKRVKTIFHEVLHFSEKTKPLSE